MLLRRGRKPRVLVGHPLVSMDTHAHRRVHERRPEGANQQQGYDLWSTTTIGRPRRLNSLLPRQHGQMGCIAGFHVVIVGIHVRAHEKISIDCRTSP